jgi:hypothetical protein
MRGEYVVLSKTEQYTVTVARDDGTFVLTHNLDHDEDGFEYPHGIGAVGSHYYILCEEGVAMYQHKNGIMSYIGNKYIAHATPHDVSGVWGNDVTVFYSSIKKRTLGFGRATHKSNERFEGWVCNLQIGFGTLPQQSDANEPRLAVSDDHIVAALRHTVRVYAEN